MLDVRKLRMLSALERLGTIAAVAEELHLTAPGISMQLSALQRELGVALTERHGRRLALTPAGRVLAAHGRDILDRLALAEMEVDAIRGGRVGKYRVAAFPSAARTLVSDAWSAIRADPAGVELTLTTPEPETALALSSREKPTWHWCTATRTFRVICPTGWSGTACNRAIWWRSDPTTRMPARRSTWPTGPPSVDHAGAKPDLLRDDRPCLRSRGLSASDRRRDHGLRRTTQLSVPARAWRSSRNSPLARYHQK